MKNRNLSVSNLVRISADTLSSYDKALQQCIVVFGEGTHKFYSSVAQLLVHI
jgi:hypothetical protein